MSNSPVGVRIATGDDLRFVASSWFHSVLKSRVSVTELPYAIFKLGMEANIQALFKKSKVLIAFASETPDEILGYAVLETRRIWDKLENRGVVSVERVLVHHVYVKQMYRRQGIARSLIGGAKTYTHPANPETGKKFAISLGMTYNPRLA